ncbi:MAG TPA: lysophospholipid acyltransferase family protein [Bdellovibrionales bacterium]|nr:lysophospholipid acyltransferase family protein [Bdellovibrionales bacterium]
MITRQLEEKFRGVNNSSLIIARALRYFATTSIEALRTRNEVELRRKLMKIVNEATKDAIRILGIDVKVIGFDEKRMKEGNFLMVGNHVSYLDILCLSSQHPALFITSVDMGQMPLLGQITKLAGCIFVERRNRSQIGRDVGTISDALKQGVNVMLYPEGTSGDGRQVLPFKKSLMMAAVDAEKDIQPVCIKYVEIDGEPFSPENADKVCWYGDMYFGPHFMGVAKLKSLKVELHFLEPIKVTKTSTRHELADQAYAAINTCYLS